MSARLRRGLLLLALGCSAWSATLLHAATVAAQDDDGDEYGGDERESAGDDNESSADDENSEDNADAQDNTEDAERDVAAEPPSDVRFQVFFGGGVGTRSFRRPLLRMGVQRMDDVPFPAVDTGLRVTAWPAESFSLEFLLHYQTSFGMEVEQGPRFAPANDVSLRANHVELSVAPQFHLGDTPSSVSLLFPIGFGLRTLWPEVHTLPVPGYTLGGPLLRAELSIPFLDVVTLRFGPEAQWVVMIDQRIVDDGAGFQGVALGGEALLQIQVSAFLGIEFAFRESHVIAPTSVVDETFVDIERFFTGRLSGTW